MFNVKFTVSFFLLVFPVVSLAQTNTERQMKIISDIGKTKFTKNSVKLLHYGSQSFPKRFEMIRDAKTHLFISTGAWGSDETGLHLLDLIESKIKLKKSQGEPFQVIVVMESMLVEKESLRRLTEMGVEVFLYRSPLWRVMNPLSAHLHKKVFIQDGKAAILGGMNIRDIYALGNTHSTGWMDTDIYVEGPAVHDMQNYFLEELKFIVEFPRQVILDIPRPHLAPTVIMNTYALLKGLNESFYHRRNKQFDLKGIEKSLSPSPAPNGKTSVAIVYDNPLMKKKKKLKEKKEARSVQILIELINNAQYQIDMISPYPYFIKDLVKSLVAAAKRGVKIRFLTNSKNSMDMSFRWLRLTAFDFTIEKLLKAGVEVYKWQGHNQIKLLEEQNGCSSAYWPGATLHSKVVRIDNEISIIHSSNFNVRSTYHNVEMGAFVISAPFNKRIRDEIFDFNINQKEKTFICKKGDEELVLSMPPKFKRTPKKYSSKKKLRNFFLKPFLKPLGSFY